MGKRNGRGSSSSLKVSNVKESEIEESIDQAMGYVEDHVVDIYLLNFCLYSKKHPPAPVRWSTQDEAHRVVVNIKHTTKCDQLVQFDIFNEEGSWRTKIGKSPASS